MTRWIFCTLLVASLVAGSADAQTTERFSIRGKSQALQVYGPRDGDPVIVSSGDGGWIHLGPQVAAMLAARGLRRRLRYQSVPRGVHFRLHHSDNERRAA